MERCLRRTKNSKAGGSGGPDLAGLLWECWSQNGWKALKRSPGRQMWCNPIAEWL